MSETELPKNYDPIEVEKRWALSHPVSDHLPVAATIRLPAATERSR